MKRLSAACLIAITLSGCGANPNAPDFTTPTAAQLRDVPEFVAVGGVPARLTPLVYRNLGIRVVVSPSDPEEGLLASLRVASTEGSPLPVDLRASRAWVVHGQDIWSAIVTEDHGALGASMHEWFIRDGPLWKPGDLVDVVIEISTGGKIARIRAASQAIGSVF